MAMGSSVPAKTIAMARLPRSDAFAGSVVVFMVVVFIDAVCGLTVLFCGFSAVTGKIRSYPTECGWRDAVTLIERFHIFSWTSLFMTQKPCISKQNVGSKNRCAGQNPSVWARDIFDTRLGG